MAEASPEQIRRFRLRSHHLDRFCSEEEIMEAVGACGMQNSPPGAWETALYCRIPEMNLKDMEWMLYEDRRLIQAWSFRGAPVVFPESAAPAFLTALIPEEGEPWIYTAGIGLALEFLGMSFDGLLELLKQAVRDLDGRTIAGKNQLDQTLAARMEPYLPREKRALWNSPSMYGMPDRQTVGGAAVSFLLRPCSFLGLVVFGRREGGEPGFASWRTWTGHSFPEAENPAEDLVKRYLHCYGPATPAMFAAWLGCSGTQARRMWKHAGPAMESVTVLGKKAFILKEDADALFSGKETGRPFLLLGGHDPYLDQRDRLILQPDARYHRRIWQTVSNPGVILWKGEAVGIWNGRKKGKKMEIRAELWKMPDLKEKTAETAETYVRFRGLEPGGMEISWTG